MDNHFQFQKDRIECKRDLFQCGKKNKGGAAFNIVTLNYEQNKEGNGLKRVDDDAMVRAKIRSKILDRKNNG